MQKRITSVNDVKKIVISQERKPLRDKFREMESKLEGFSGY